MTMGLGSMPSPLIEATNGVLLWLYAYMAAFALGYVIWKWHKALPSFGGRHGWWRAARITYFEQKPAISIAVIASGLFVRTLPLWYWRHLSNHHAATKWWLLDISARELFWIGTAMITLGMICWVRVVSPFRYTNPSWIVMISFALGFGIAMALGVW